MVLISCLQGWFGENQINHCKIVHIYNHQQLKSFHHNHIIMYSMLQKWLVINEEG